MNFLFTIVLNSKHQVQVHQMGITSVDFQVVDQVIKHSHVKTLYVFYNQQNWSIMGINVILFQNLLDSVKSLIFDDVWLDLLIFHNFSQVWFILIFFEHMRVFENWVSWLLLLFLSPSLNSLVKTLSLVVNWISWSLHWSIFHCLILNIELSLGISWTLIKTETWFHEGGDMIWRNNGLPFFLIRVTVTLRNFKKHLISTFLGGVHGNIHAFIFVKLGSEGDSKSFTQFNLNVLNGSFHSDALFFIKHQVYSFYLAF